jgi:formate hydrogenlyase subunit 3/multisubunit Na+/H+ antiporter MnhD subunit
VNGALLLLSWLAPLAALPVALGNRGRWWPPLATLPSLAAALLVPAGSTVEVPWLLLGARLGLDPTSQVFLAFTAVLWLAAGLQAAAHMHRTPHAGRFRLYFLLAMSGNFGLIVGQDLVSFYFGFALMGLAAYGLVVHDGNDTVRRAGRVYLVMTLVSEVALFAGFLFLYQRTGTLTPAMDHIAGAGALELGLLVLAFGIKAGLIGLHMWLPLAHPAAPVPASAVLSGAMIKAALIGWLRFLPLGQQSLPEWGAFLATAGAATALLALPLGIVQRDPKVVLAYSSVSKMGLMVFGLGIAAVLPDLAPSVAVALAFFAAHHGLAKGALFLGVGVVKSSAKVWPLMVLALPALVLVGAPFTSGALAKDLLKRSLVGAPLIWEEILTWTLVLTALGSTLLMGRFLFLMHLAAGSGGSKGTASALPWLGLVVISLGLPLVHGAPSFDLSDTTLMLAAAVAASAVALRPPAVLAKAVGWVPPGDILYPLVRISRQLGATLHVLRTRCRTGLGRELQARWADCSSPLLKATQVSEAALRKQAAAGLLWLSVFVLLLIALLRLG